MWIDPNPRPPDDDSFVKGKNWWTRRAISLISALTPKCTEVTRILSQGMDRHLSLKTRLQLRIHYLMCSFCKRYGKQLQYMRLVAREFPEKASEVSSAKLSDETKAGLKEKLRALR